MNAFRIIDPIDGLAKHVISGNSLRKFKDQDGQYLTDSYLVKLLKSEVSWVEEMYETLSGWVHFSENHIFSAASPGDTDGSFVLAIGELESIPDQLFVEATCAIEAIHSSTAELIDNYFKRLAAEHNNSFRPKPLRGSAKFRR